MRTLEEALVMFGGQTGRSVYKHLSKGGIVDFDDCTTEKIGEWLAGMRGTVAANTLRTYMSVFKHTLKQYEDTGRVPCGNLDGKFRIRGEDTQKVYLTEEELDMLEKVIPKNAKEKVVLLSFLIGARTGMRISDTRTISMANIHNGMLTYVSKKTSIEATIPVSTQVQGYIAKLACMTETISLVNYEKSIRRLCARADISDVVTVFRGGETMTKPKYEFVTSHTARATFCTILAQKGVPIIDIMTLAGHSSPDMTARYIVRSTPKLNNDALKFLQYESKRND